MPARPPAPVVQPAAGGPPQPAGGGLLAKLGGSRNAPILAAGATVAVVALLTLLRGGKAKTDDTDQTTKTDTFDSGPYDMWDQWQQQYESLQGRVSTLENPPVPTPIPKATLPATITKPPIVIAHPPAAPGSTFHPPAPRAVVAGPAIRRT